MHELSLALEVVDLATREAKKHGVSEILEMEIEVGTLSGVELQTFQSALEMVVMNTLLQNTLIKINNVPAIGRCSSCSIDFDMNERMATCPSCHDFPSEIQGGQDFKVVAIVVE